MRSARLVPLAASALAVLTIAACGSSATKTAATPPAPAKLALHSGAGDEARSALYPVRPIRYVLDGSLADLGADAPVYRLVGHAVTEADVARIAGVLGLHGAPVRTEWGYEVRDGDALLNVETNAGTTWLDYSSAGNAGASVGGSSGSSGTSGSVIIEPVKDVVEPVPAPNEPTPPDAPDTTVTDEPPAPLPTTPAPVDVPSADDAARIAQQLLDDLGVLDGQQWTHTVNDTSSDVAVSCAADAPCPPTPDPVIFQRDVSYALMLDGATLPDVGWNVTVGSRGAIEAVSGTWATPEPAGTYPLRSTADVFADLQHDRAQYVGAQPLAASASAVAEIARGDSGAAGGTGGTGAEPDPVSPQDVHVTGVSAGRARWDGTDGGRPAVYVLPTYRFHAQVDRQPSYEVEVLALDPSGFTLAAPAPTPEPAPAPEPAAR